MNGFHWGGKEWFNKDKDTTIDEVVGYQLAAAIGIPLVSPNFKLVTGKRLLYPLTGTTEVRSVGFAKSCGN